MNVVEKNKIERNNQEILVGSTKLNYKSQNKFDKNEFMLNNMEYNLAYTHTISKNCFSTFEKEEILENFKQRFTNDVNREFNEAKEQVKKIATFRLNEIIN